MNDWVIDATPEDFIMALKLRMRQSRISQNRLAKATGIQPQHVSKYMQGKIPPSMRTRVRMWRGVLRIEGEDA